MEIQGIKTSLRDYFRILCYWKGTVVLLFLVIFVTTLVVTLIMPPIYKAFTLVLIEQEPRHPILYKDYDEAGVPYQLSVIEEKQEPVTTQSEIIKSRNILEKVVLNFDLASYFEEPNQVEKAIKSLQDRVDIEITEKTNIVKLSVEDQDPELGAQIANAIANTYVEWLSEAKMAKTKGASGALSERIEEVGKEVKEIENSLDQLKKKGNVATLKEEMSAAVMKLADFDSEHEHVLANIAEVEVRLTELKEGLGEEEGLTTASQIINNPAINTLKLRLLELELKRTQLLSKYNKESVVLESVKEEIVKTKKELSNEINNVVNSLQIDLSALQAKKASLEEAKNRYSARLRQLSDIELVYKRLQRELNIKNELYISLLGKQAETSMTETIEKDLLVKVRIIDPAKVPLMPIKPNKILNAILGCIVGVMSGIGGAFLREYWDHSLKTVDEIKRFTEIPVLATVPKAKGKTFSLYAPGSSMAENFHTLSTGVQQLCRENGINTLLVTSASPDEGKSVVCANLAVSLAAIEGKKVLVIDGNLRKPAMHRFFETRIQNNFVGMLSKKDPIKPDSTDIRNLDVIATTQDVSEPSRLLASDAIRDFINKVKDKYDYVIFDSPALVSYPEASTLGFNVEGIIFVVRFGQTKHEVVERAKALLDKSQRKILGAVLNGVEYVIPAGLYKRL